MLQWVNEKKKEKKKVLVAAEESIGQVIADRLREIPPYDDEDKWSFELAGDSSQLISNSDIDVIILSRFLPGDSPMGTLDIIRDQFADAHTVLLVGPKNAQSQQYIQQSKAKGFRNIVSGNLPGDLPYTLDLALRYTLDEVMKSSSEKQSKIKQEKGFVVAVAGAKGGIGKTSVCAGLALAMSGATNTVAMDSDYTRVDLTAFFKVDPQCAGIEEIDPSTVTTDDIEQLLVPVKKTEKLRCLPGPSIRTDWDWMRWPSDDVAKVLDAVSETAPLVIVDTPSNNECSYIPDILRNANIVVVVIDQSMFSAQDIFSYGESLAENGVESSNVRVVVNKWLSKGKTAQNLLKEFYRGLGGSAPRVVHVPADLEAFILGSHQMKIPGLDDPKGPWQVLAADIARTAGFPWKAVEKKRGFIPFWKRFAS